MYYAHRLRDVGLHELRRNRNTSKIAVSLYTVKHSQFCKVVQPF